MLCFEFFVFFSAMIFLFDFDRIKSVPNR